MLETACYVDEDGVEQRVVFYKDGNGVPMAWNNKPLTEQERMDLIE